jgi:hypothetical protein
MKITAKNDLVVDTQNAEKQWVVGLYDETGYNLCQVDMFAASKEDNTRQMAPQVVSHYHEDLSSCEQAEICARLCDAIEQAFNDHPEDLSHFYRVIEHTKEFSFEI